MVPVAVPQLLLSVEQAWSGSAVVSLDVGQHRGHRVAKVSLDVGQHKAEAVFLVVD